MYIYTHIYIYIILGPSCSTLVHGNVEKAGWRASCASAQHILEENVSIFLLSECCSVSKVFFPATCCNTLHHNRLHHTATHCNPLQHIATHCNTLQHSATLCNTLQHNATTLQHSHPPSQQPSTIFSDTLQHTATFCYTATTLQLYCNNNATQVLAMAQIQSAAFY